MTADLAAVLAATGRGVAAEEVALERGRLDAVIAGLLHGGAAAQRGERPPLGATSPRRGTCPGPPEDRVAPLSPQMVGLRFQASARAAGVEPVTAHSGRVGLASELTRRGASTTDVMLVRELEGRAEWWRTYSAGATAERGAVAQYL